MRLKLSCADYSFPLLPHEHVLDLISMLEFEAVDIGLFGERSHVRPENALKDIKTSANDLLVKVKDKGLKIATIFFIPKNLDFLSLATNNPDAKQRQKARDLFQRTLEFIVSSEVTHMSAGAGVNWDHESTEDSFKRDAQELVWRVERAKDLGVTFAIEPHADSLAATPKDTLRLLGMTPGLTLALDYAHFTRHGIFDSEVEPLLKYTSHFHARCASKGRLQVSFRDNTIDFVRILSVMKSVGFQGYITIEYVWTEWERCNEVDNLSETILLRDFIRNIEL